MRALLPVALLVPAMLAAQSPQWSRPYVADARFWLQKAGERRGQPLIAGQTVELEAGQEATLTVEPQDQWGRPFPPELSGFFVDDPRSCQGLVTVESSSPTTFRLTAGTERGRCQLRLVAGGNLNLEWTFTLKVASVAHGGYTRGQAEYIATRLYRALLAREPDPEGFRAADRATGPVEHADLPRGSGGNPAQPPGFAAGRHAQKPGVQGKMAGQATNSVLGANLPGPLGPPSGQRRGAPLPPGGGTRPSERRAC